MSFVLCNSCFPKFFMFLFQISSGFSLGRLHMGIPPYGGQSVNGGTHEEEHRPYGGGGGLTLIDYVIN